MSCCDSQFGVLYEHRASDLLKRMDVINTIVDCIPQVTCQPLPCTHCCFHFVTACIAALLCGVA